MTGHPETTLPEDALWTGRGTAALIGLLRAAVPLGSGVLVPVNLCGIAVAGIIWSGMRPIFHDVSELHGNGEVRHLEAADTSDCAVLIAVSNFGRAIDIAGFRTWADQRHMLLVEDVCNAAGATYRGRPLGETGGAAIYSFNHGKNMSFGHGGAVTVREPALRARVARALDEMPSFTRSHAVAIERLETELRASRLLASEQVQFAAQFAAYESYRPYVAFKPAPDWPSGISQKLASLPANVRHRRLLSDRYRRKISAEAVTHTPPDDEAAPWRHSILVPPERRDALLVHLRTRGFHASAWYPPVHGIFAPDAVAVYPEAQRFAARVVNLWVDLATDVTTVDRTSVLINHFFDEPAS
jgi:dTDP-4-amino-4,6-dideoxygalactose transaminase